ncbi:MAG TPA: Bax inhibitor-1/YccA family protein [Bacillota bacterium]|nr:Bax inhibitor-1/YccA family protein [Bacillota bacterium]
MELSHHRVGQQDLMARVYGWMTLALVVTAGVAYYTATSEAILSLIFSSSLVFYGLLIGELVLVGYLVVAVNRMSAAAATGAFVGYSVLNGLTLSVIFLVYTQSSIAFTFLICAGMFGVMSAYGYLTKSDLSSWGDFLFMGLVGIIIASLANFFFRNETVYWVITYIGIMVFTGLTAYDTQKIKRMSAEAYRGAEGERKAGIMGALILYLDFINLFLMLLRVFGRRR